MHNILDTHQGGLARVPTPDELAGILHEPIPPHGGKATARPTQGLLQSHWFGRRIGSEMLQGPSLWTEDAGVYKSSLGPPN